MDVSPYEPAQAGLGVLGIAISIGLSYLASLLYRRSSGDGPGVKRDDTPTTIASRGSYVPLVIGKRRVGHVFGWAGSRRVIVNREESGGKGGGGITTEETTYREGGWHLLCVGPVRSIHGIYANGKLIYGETISNDGDSTPSTVSTEAGDFTVYWGSQDQSVIGYLGRADRVGIRSRWPSVCSVLWNPKELGPSPQWEQIEYLVETGCPGNHLNDSDYDLDDGTSSGVNPAHAIYQILTAPHPHGCGLDPDLIDQITLEAMGVLCQDEHLPLNMLIENGQTADKAIAAILADTGHMMTQIDGRLAFVPIRAPAGDVPSFDVDTTAGPLPEIEVAHGPAHLTRVVYLFANEDANYRDFDVKGDDDGNADESFQPEEVRLETITNGDVAAKVAARREAEEYGDSSAITLTVLRGGRLLYPGQSIDVDDVGRCRVLGVEIDVNAPGARVEAALDAYAVPEADGSFDGGADAGEPLDPEPDLAFTWFELPESLSPQEGRIVVFRVAAHDQITGALIYGSIDGGASYTRVGRQDQPAAGGELIDALASGSIDVENGPIFEALDDLTADVLDLSASTANWEAGQQLAVFESADGLTREVTFLRNVTVQSESEWVTATAYSEGDAVIPTADAIQTGLRYVCTTGGTSGATEPTWPTSAGETVDDNGVVWEARYFRYQLHGIKRAQYGTSGEAFATGDTVYIIEADSLSIIHHAIIKPGETLCVKSQPQANGTSVALSSVTAECHAITGFGS